MAILSAAGFLLVACTSETEHKTLQQKMRRRMSPPGSLRGWDLPAAARMSAREFFMGAVGRPLRMLVTEPIVGLLSLYVAFAFAVLFAFFGALPWVFGSAYGLPPERACLVFLAVAGGCIFGVFGIVAPCTRFFYERRARACRPGVAVPSEYRLLPAMIAGVLLPVSIFWFSWAVRMPSSPPSNPYPTPFPPPSWQGPPPAAPAPTSELVSPVAAIALFGAGNICLFVSALQYKGDVYHRTVVASAASANAFARYALAAVFPLFSLKSMVAFPFCLFLSPNFPFLPPSLFCQFYGDIYMLTHLRVPSLSIVFMDLGVHWASLVLGCIAAAMIPVPFILYFYGQKLRARSSYETASN